ncbi:uncharacterized protein LOC131348571 isoform X2 [Hemibagrus wyckioides]|uniref:uncharacterized protein LOC131348571 isoform X2 n=1 Tax=Hemibagrus wyckioides TaxID=337641 RepID=UPI00266CFD10|nr:uncharacterized protein LOC131348571 isoform X2 [Hemibagrus wyckioides]
MPELIEVGEKETGDSERVKTTEKGYLERTTELQETHEALCSDEKLSEIIAAEVHLCSLSFPETNNSPAKEAKEVEAASEERWSNSKMLQNSDGNGKKAGGLPVDCSLGMDSLSAASEKETGTASVEDMAVVAASTSEFNDRRDWKRKSSESLEKKGEGGTEEGIGKKRGGAQTLYRQEALSMTVPKSYPLHDNGVTLVAPQQRGELITLVTADIADTALPLLTGSKTIASSLINPSSSVFLLNATEAERKEASERAAHLKESINALGENQPNSDILNLLSAASADGKDPAAQTSYQQVPNTSRIQTEINLTQQNKAGTGKDTCQNSEVQHPSSTAQLDMRSSTGSFNNMDGGTGGTQDDTTHQVTGFASLPPLTVHENLWYPVSETSFSFQGLFSNRNPDLPLKAAYTTCESTTEAEVTEENMTVNENPEKHIDGERGNDLKEKTANNITVSAEESPKSVNASDTKTSENNAVNQNPDLLPKNKEENEGKDGIVIIQSTIEHKPTLEDTNGKRLELQDIVMEEVRSDKIKFFSLSDLTVSDVEKKSEVVLATKETDGREAKSVERDVRETCEDNFQSIPSDSAQQEPKLELQTSEGVSQEQCLKFEETPLSCTDGDDMLSRHSSDSTGISKKDLKENTEQDGAISVGCHQAKCEELQYQMNSSHDTGPASEVSMGVVSTKDPAPTAIKVSSAVDGGVPSASANVQSDTKEPIVLRPPGPMMSHWEVINDYNVSLTGEGIQCKQEAEMSSNIVETDTVQKTDPMKTTGEKIEINTSLSCMNVLIPDVTVMVSSVQDTKLASKEVEGTQLISDSQHGEEKTNKMIDCVVFEDSKDGKVEVNVKPGAPEKLLNMGHKEEALPCSIQSTAQCTRKDDMLSSQSTHSTAISQQDQIPNTVILEKCSEVKPEKNKSELQYQTDLVHDSGADMSAVSKKELTLPEKYAFGMGEGGLSSSNIQSDSKVPIVHGPPGPMMSHREAINDYNVSVSEEETECNYNKISPMNSGLVGAADLGNKVVKTDTVEKPEEHSESVETKRDLISDTLTDAASSEQDIKLAAEEVEGTILAPDSFHSNENANQIKSSQSTNSNDMSQQSQKSNAVILDECFQTKPEENMSMMQGQTDIDHSGVVSEVDMSTACAKDLTHPDLTLSGMGEGEAPSSTIQSDPLETPKEHSEPVDSMREKNGNDNSSQSVMASSVQDTRPFETLDIPQAELESDSPAKDCESVIKEQPEEPPDCRPLLSESADGSESVLSFPPPPEEDTLPPALPVHLFCDSSEFPTPPPTPPDSALLEPEPEWAPPVSPPAPDQVPNTAEVLLPQLQHDQQPGPPARSSDSDGTFETPESTTPVKTAAPPIPSVEQPEPITQPVTSTDTDSCPLPASTVDASASEVQDSPSFHPPSRSLSTVFDEDKPIASSGTYNLDHILNTEPLSAPAFDSGSSGLESRTPLTRSLSFQSGELESSSPGDAGGAFNRATHPRSESFSVGTESAPGTLRRVKKPRPGSLKKKPLSRQNSNPESATSRTVSSSSTPEVKKNVKLLAESPLQTQEEKECPPASPSPSPSPAGTLRRTRIKSRVESPPPVVEESSPAQTQVTEKAQEEILSVPEEDSPILTSATYKWDPDNFENINPFCTGGSKIANSPVLGRKTDFIPAPDPVPTPIPIEEPSTAPAPSSFNIEEQPITKRQSVRLEFDYSEESGDTPQDSPLPPKKLGKKQGAKMPLRKPKLGIKKAPPQTEQLDNTPAAVHLNDNDDIPIPKASYNFDPNKWDDHNFNPFSSGKGIPNSPPKPRASYNFDPDSFDDSVDPFKPSNKMGNSPPKAGSLEMSSNDNEIDNDNVDELGDQNQNKPVKNKKKPLKSNTFRVKKSPKRSPLSEQVVQDTSADAMPDHLQDHATDEEKLASSTNQKWVARHDVQVELTSDIQDFPQPSDLTAFVNESSLPSQSHDYEIEYMEKIGKSTPPLSVKKPSLYLNLDPVTESTNQGSSMHHSGPNSPCTGSFEEMEAKISMEGKSPVLSSCGVPEPLTMEKIKKREVHSQSRGQSSERDGTSPSQGPVDPADLSLLDRLSESATPLSYLEPDLAETNPTAFAHKLQEELVLAALRMEALQVAQNISQSPSLSTVSPQERELASPGDSGVSKSSLYSRTGYSEAESPYLPQDLDHSLGIAREEIVAKEKEVLEWQRKYEDSRQELEEMKRIVTEYEKTIAQMIEDDQREKSLSHHTIQQLILEKDQALADLNSVEKSLADLFRRYEKMKDVLEGFRKNEDVLKKCAQEYLSRVRKEEQRYQALKIHAEEKLDKANAEIAQVRAKAKQEQAAYQASLRKEQMKVDSLERTLDQKNKEIEELTKICDELIAKMGKS